MTVSKYPCCLHCLEETEAEPAESDLVTPCHEFPCMDCQYESYKDYREN